MDDFDWDNIACDIMDGLPWQGALILVGIGLLLWACGVFN